MQLSSDVRIPDGLLAANALLSEKPHQGVPSWNLALHQGIDERNSTAAIGLRVGQHLNRAWSRYTGKERDAESGLDFFGARYYASTMGHWMNPDWSAKAEPVPYAKLDNPQSLNLYAYVNNNPVSSVDPDGHQDFNHASGPNSLGYQIDQILIGISEAMYAQQQAEATATGAQATTNPEPAAPQQWSSSVAILGKKVGVTLIGSLSSDDATAIMSKIVAAAGLINSNADSLSAGEKAAIGDISSFSVVASGTLLGSVGNGSMALSAAYVEGSSAAWIGSTIGHEGQHDLDVGKYSGDNLWRGEQAAGRTQLGIGNKIGFTPAESQHLEQWIDDRNRAAMQQHMQQGYSY